MDSIDESSISEKLKLTVYRIVQEQLNNILKHAKAKTIVIMLREKNGILRLRINDDGIGFDINLKRNGVGLQNIISRAELFHGKAVINSQPGMGCELIVDFKNEPVVSMNSLAQAS